MMTKSQSGEGFSAGSPAAAARLNRLLLNQALLEELHDPLARLIGGMQVDLADLECQHRVGHLAETVLVTLLRVDLDDLEGVPESVLQRLEACAWRQGIFA